MRANKDKLPVRRNILGLLALGTTMVALAGVKLAPKGEDVARSLYNGVQTELASPGNAPREHSSGYTDEQFAKMPQKPLTAGRGAGFYDLVACANPPSSDVFSAGVAEEERRYLENELEANAGRRGLQPGDVLETPVVPTTGQKADISPSVCEPQ